MSEIKRLSRVLSVMAVLGWLADTSARASLHHSWSAVIAGLNTAISLWLAIALHKAIKRA